MQKIKQFNNISEALAKQIQMLQPGETVVYELVNFDKDHLTGRPLYGGAISLRGRDRIKDGDSFIEIGLPRLIEGELVKKCEEYVIDGGGSNGSVPGRFELSGDNHDHVRWHWFFQLCNYNESNPNADANTKKKIRLVDLDQEAKQHRTKRSILREALNKAENMSADEVRMIAASLNWESSGKLEVLRDRVEAYAQANPKDFVARVDDPNVRAKAELGMAKEKGIIMYDQANHSVKDANGNLIATLERVEGKEWLEQLFETLRTMKNGPAIILDIRGKIKKKLDADVSAKNKSKADNTK